MAALRLYARQRAVFILLTAGVAALQQFTRQQAAFILQDGWSCSFTAIVK